MDPSRVSQQMPDGDDTPGRPSEHPSAFAVVADENLRLGEFLEIVCDRIVEPERSILAQSQDADRDHGLGQRGDRKDIVGAECRILIDASAAERSLVNDPSLRSDVESNTRNVVSLDRSPDDPISFIEAQILRRSPPGVGQSVTTNPSLAHSSGT
jgi:hypothetical protein